MSESPIFVRTYDFVVWLIPCTLSFPRSQRFIITKRLQDHTLDFYESLIDAAMNYGRQREAHLRAADARLVKVRKYLRITRDLNWLSAQQYKFAAEQVTEIGKLLGGWRNPKKATPASP